MLFSTLNKIAANNRRWRNINKAEVPGLAPIKNTKTNAKSDKIEKINSRGAIWRTICYAALVLGALRMAGIAADEDSAIRLASYAAMWTGWNVLWVGALISSKISGFGAMIVTILNANEIKESTRDSAKIERTSEC